MEIVLPIIQNKISPAGAIGVNTYYKINMDTITKLSTTWNFLIFQKQENITKSQKDYTKNC